MRECAEQGEAQHHQREVECTVVRDEAVLWTDGSLGCPRPGVMYTQAEVPGYWVELEIAGRRFDYRFGDLGVPIPCER